MLLLIVSHELIGIVLQCVYHHIELIPNIFHAFQMNSNDICFCVLFKCSGSSAHNCPGADATFNTESSWEGVAIIENRVEDESWVHPWMQRQRLWGTGGLKVLSRRIKNKSRNLQSLVIPQMFIHPSWDQRRWWSEIDQWSEIHYPLYVWRLVED